MQEEEEEEEKMHPTFPHAILPESINKSIL